MSFDFSGAMKIRIKFGFNQKSSMHNEDLNVRDLTPHENSDFIYFFIFSDFILIVIFEHSEQKAHIYFTGIWRLRVLCWLCVGLYAK